MFVDPLAEKFVGWTPYHYVHQNPINLIDPTGMSAEGLDHDPPKENAKGEKVLHIKYHGKDVSIYENDDNILARGYRAFKEIRKKSDEFLSGGFHFDDDDNKPKGVQDSRKQPKLGQKVERINAAGAVAGGSFAKITDGTGFKYNNSSLDLEKSAKITNSLLTGYNTGHNIPESKVTIDVSVQVWDTKRGNNKPYLSEVIKKDTTVNLKDLQEVRWSIINLMVNVIRKLIEITLNQDND